MKPIWRRQQVEDLALITLLDFRRQTGLRLAPPLDVDLVGEITCQLQWDWDVLPEPAGTVIWAALFPSQRTVVLNETHLDRFAAKSGLERFTKAHEIGHWVLHVNAATAGGGVASAVVSGETSHMFCRGDDLPGHDVRPINWIERHADWFAGALLMPANIFVPAAEQYDLTDWRSLYELARRFDVTISALCVRLMHLGLSSVDGQGHLQSPPPLPGRSMPFRPVPVTHARPQVQPRQGTQSR